MSLDGGSGANPPVGLLSDEFCILSADQREAGCAFRLPWFFHLRVFLFGALSTRFTRDIHADQREAHGTSFMPSAYDGSG
jgi:hypothetical protein